MINSILYYSPYYVNTSYYSLILAALILSVVAQIWLSKAYRENSKTPNQRNLSGRLTAQYMLQSRGVLNVRIEKIPGTLNDHYDPINEVLRLSEAIYDGTSIASVAVAAHEAGHAIQFHQGFLPGVIRTRLFPIARVGSTAGPYFALFGIFLQSSLLFQIGILLYLLAFAFYLITLPVEFDASRRALAILGDEQMLNQEELRGARKVLQAAAMTYIASALIAFVSVLRLILMNRRYHD